MDSAVENAEKEAKEKAKYEAEMIKKGYRKELKLINPDTCYQHVYRSLRMRDTGRFFLLLTLLMGWFIAISLERPAILITVIIVTIILFVSGLSMALNRSRVVNNNKKDHEELDGYKFLFTNSNHHYEYEWVLKVKNKPTAEEEKNFYDWLKKTKKNKDGK